MKLLFESHLIVAYLSETCWSWWIDEQAGVLDGSIEVFDYLCMRWQGGGQLVK